MKYLPQIAATLLGLLFIAAAIMFLTGNTGDEPAPVEGSPKDHFMKAFGPTGYMHMVKVFELIGGILLLIPKTRNYGLLVIGPILINILAFHQFVANDGIFQPMLIVPSLLALYLLWSARRAFAGLSR